ncbi:MAG: ATPase [Chloroflexota bacterium]|nr:ATPase [Chloroflexota bacterium]
MDIMYLIDRLEALVNSSRRVPLSSRIMVEEDEVLALIEQLRQTVPSEVKQARRVLQEREQVIKAAQTEAEKIVTMARDRAEYMINQEGVLSLARERGEQVLTDAQRDAHATRQEIEQYAVDVLGNLEQQLQLQLHQVRNGLQELQTHQPAR